ncbi:CRP-like cAMP-binding protein [Desulfobaculum xiamenense]|uniref:CRP-like cAMP-binding protein n=1 Tax=Desulfobaculum xiamenense TaxID=995050 RepID=A0A846QK01_9BACT|nr:Crp/Fnr family transcriptional regulator [Desulfobaculum xiamenense]NJB66503.1 CRP-like cAMP-binding protein [Desulfobaculum xiamenense]
MNMLEVLESPEHSDFSRMFRERRFLKNNMIFTPEEAGNQIFVVKRGRIRVFLADEDKEFNLAILKEGDAYTTHTRASLQALTDTTILVSEMQTFGRQAADSPYFSLATLTVLGEHLRNTLNIINRLAFKDIKMRLCDFLLQEARDKGEENRAGVVVSTGLSVKQIADFVGSTRQTVSTLLNEMQKDGVLTRLSRGKYVIHELGELENGASSSQRPTMVRRRAD